MLPYSLFTNCMALLGIIVYREASQHLLPTANR